MDEQQFKALIATGRETESLEVKAGGPRTDPFLGSKVIRAALGMTNHEGGGWIVVGIEEKADGSFDPTGVALANLATWNHDDVSAMINGCAEPHIALDTFLLKSDGKDFVVVRVHEFVDIPVVCRSNGPTPTGSKAQIYRAGVCYARSRRKPETIDALSDPTTWRTLIELANTKATRRTLSILGSSSSHGRPGKSDREQFEAQLEDLK